MRTINAAADDDEVDTNMMKTITNIILFQNNNVSTPDGAPQREIKFKKVGSASMIAQNWVMKWRICVKSYQEVEADFVEGPPDAERE